MWKNKRVTNRGEFKLVIEFIDCGADENLNVIRNMLALIAKRGKRFFNAHILGINRYVDKYKNCIAYDNIIDQLVFVIR